MADPTRSQNFLHEFLDIAIPSAPYKLHFHPDMEGSNEKIFPICIEVPNGQADRVASLLIAESEKLTSTCSLLPTDVVKISELSEVSSITVVEEAFHTGGSPWKFGTLGAIMAGENDSLIGITCGHVQNPSNLIGREIPNCDIAPDVVHSVVNDSMDFAAILLKKGEPKIYNMMPLSLNFDISSCSLGEDVYKMGCATGLTVGKLSDTALEFRCPTNGKLYQDCIAVTWNHDEVRFAFDGDCGSVYCIKRGGYFVPIGIHKISGESCSYGSSFFDALQYLPDEIYPKSFENAPHCN